MAHRSSPLPAVPVLALGLTLIAMAITADLDTAGAASLSQRRDGAVSASSRAEDDAYLRTSLATAGSSMSLDRATRIDASGAAAIGTAAADRAAVGDAAAAADLAAAVPPEATGANLDALRAAAEAVGAAPSPSVLSTLNAYQEAMASGDVSVAAHLIASIATAPVGDGALDAANVELGMNVDPITASQLTAAIDANLAAQAAND